MSQDEPKQAEYAMELRFETADRRNVPQFFVKHLRPGSSAFRDAGDQRR